MEGGNKPAQEKWAYGALAVALAGLICYEIRQGWTPSSTITGVFYELLYIFFIYMLMPFTFSGLLLAIIDYTAGRLRGSRGNDKVSIILLAASFAFAFYVAGPVMGEAAIIKATAGFLVFRLIRQYL